MLTDYERSSIKWLESLNISEFFPYKENGILKSATSLYEVYYKVVLSYETIEVIDEKNDFYSVNDLKNIESIINYQNKMCAKYSPFKSGRVGITDDVVKSYSHQQIKDILTKSNRKNRGIYYVSSLNGYTSTTLFENPVMVRADGAKRSHKERLFGHISVVVLETLRLFDDTKVLFSYPVSLDGKTIKCSSIYDVYHLVFNHPNELKLVNERHFYSKQQRKTIKRLRKVGGIV